MNVYVERQGAKRIQVTFEYDRRLVDAVRAIEGRRWHKEGKYWSVPLDLAVCRQLRDAFGKALTIGPDLHAWATAAVRQEATLGSLASAEDANLDRLPQVAPTLAATLHGFQRAGCAFVAGAPATLIADQPGLGKTLEAIGGLFEAEAVTGPILVVAPLTAVETVWGYELARWQQYPVYVPTGNRAQRQATLDDFAAAKGPRWLVVNPAMVQWRKDDTNLGPHTIQAKEKDWFRACRCGQSKKPHWHYRAAFDAIDSVTWHGIVVDECHKGAVRDPQTITAKSLYDLDLLDGGKKVALSGTPMTSKAIDLWGILHWLRPDVFTSRWQWAERWCIIERNAYGSKIGPLRQDRKEEFFRSLTPYVLRRTKGEVLKELPPKRFVDMWCEMDPKQAKQYASMAKAAMVTIGEDTVAPTSVLAEFMRLKQFAVAEQVMGQNGKLQPTAHSGKLETLLEILEERGIFDESIPEDQAEKVVVFSQFETVVTLVADALRERGVEVSRITGKESKRGQRAQLQRAFQQDGGTRVMVMTTTAGGVAITLDRADTVVFMDEMWSPSDMEQAEDRVHRASRIHNVTIYNLRTRGTIDEYIMDVVDSKESLFAEVLDIRRRMLEDLAKERK